MKKALALIAVLGLASGAAFAGCGKKVDVSGKLTGLDLESKKVTVDGKAFTLVPTALIPLSWIKDGKLEVPKDAQVVVTHEHNKAEKVTQKKAS